MPLTVHHLQVSQSERIVWLCEELGLEYKLQLHKRSPILSPPEIKALNPLGAAPIIEDDLPNGKHLVLSESGAIGEYLCQKHGDGRLILKPDHADYADFLYWNHMSNANLQPAGYRLFVVARLGLAEDNPVKQGYDQRFEVLLKHYDERLRSNTWLAGEEFTLADVMTLTTFTTMRAFFSYSLEGYDGILGWMQRCGARPAFKKAAEKGDPDTDVNVYMQAQTPPVFAPMRPKV